MAYCNTRIITEWGIAFLKHLNVADASCLSDNGNKWPHDSIEPGCLVKSRAGVGAGGLSPSSSFAGSFIFWVASAACLARVRGVASAPTGLLFWFLVCSGSAEPCGWIFSISGGQRQCKGSLRQFCTAVDCCKAVDAIWVLASV